MALTTVPTTTAITTCSYSRGDLFDTLTVNDTKFAIFNKPLQNSNQSPNLAINASHCVFLEHMEAEQDIVINATNILAFGSFSAKTIDIHANNFYDLGIEAKGDLFIIETAEDMIISGNIVAGHLDTKGRRIQAGLTEEMREIATEVKRLFSQEINDNGLQIAQALLMAAEVSSKKAQPLLLKDI